MGKRKNTRQHRSLSVNRVCIAIGSIMVVTGVGLLSGNYLDNMFETQESTRVIGLLQETISSSPDPDRDNGIIYVDGNEYIGIIEIPSINLTLPVLSSCENGNLNKGICLYYSNGNYVIGGHNRISQFRSLYDMKLGDRLIFYDLYSNKREYSLVKTEVLLPDDIEGFTMNEYGMTLFTCYWNNYERYVLRFA